MPKQKSHSGSKKRFDITGTGKVKRAQSGKNHKTGEKTRKRKKSSNKLIVRRRDGRAIK